MLKYNRQIVQCSETEDKPDELIADNWHCPIAGGLSLIRAIGKISILLSVFALWGLTAPQAQAATTTNLFVSSSYNSRVNEYNGATGEFITDFVPSGSGGLSEPEGLTFGPNGNLFVSSLNDNSIKEYNGATGEFITNFVASGSGGLYKPVGLTFGANGNLFVSSFSDSSVKEYNGVTGAFITNFVSSGSGGLSGPIDLTFAPNGNLFVSSLNNNSVNEYSGTTGAFITNFISSGSGGLSGAQGLRFGPNGNLFVSSFNNDSVNEYSGTTGAFITDFVPSNLYIPGFATLIGPVGLTFGPNDNLFVIGAVGPNNVKEYNGATGTFINDFFPPASGGLNSPTFLTFSPSTPVPEPDSTLGLLTLGAWIGGSVLKRLLWNTKHK